MIEVGSTFWIMLIAMWATGAMAFFAGVSWGSMRERSRWNDWSNRRSSYWTNKDDPLWIDAALKPYRHGPPDAW